MNHHDHKLIGVSIWLGDDDALDDDDDDDPLTIPSLK